MNVQHDDSVATHETTRIHRNRDGRITLQTGHAQLDWPNLDTFLTWVATIVTEANRLETEATV